jgi:hypothetical protein
VNGQPRSLAIRPARWLISWLPSPSIYSDGGSHAFIYSFRQPVFLTAQNQMTVIERNPRLVHREEQDIADGLRGLSKDEGINVFNYWRRKNARRNGLPLSSV